MPFYEQTNPESQAEPGGWVPIAPGFWINYQTKREMQHRLWIAQATDHNRRRSIGAKLLRRHKVDADTMMREEAVFDNGLINVNNIPHTLKAQRASGRLLRAYGFSPDHRFGSHKEIEDALGDKIPEPINPTSNPQMEQEQDAFTHSVLRDLINLPLTDDPTDS